MKIKIMLFLLSTVWLYSTEPEFQDRRLDTQVKTQATSDKRNATYVQFNNYNTGSFAHIYNAKENRFEYIRPINRGMYEIWDGTF